ncbi:MAG: RrF2 family transcriptional regulator [Planctomycetota bacterium]|jgi:Rrf2 family protein
MLISKKCQYALRAVLELALRNTDQPVKIREIAAAQNIPIRFLEIILNEVRHAGFVQSRRGKDGGYLLTCPAEQLAVGDIIRCVGGPILMAEEGERRRHGAGVFWGDRAFARLWQDISGAISEVWDNTTFAELVEYERTERSAFAPNYTI